MSKVFRIVDEFNISGRGKVYLIIIPTHMNLRCQDVLYDLHGHRFRIKAFEMFRRCFTDTPLEELPVGVMFENIDDVEVNGKILVDSLTNINFLFCNHPLYQRRVDEDYQDEFQAAGLNHPCALFNYEDMEKGTLSLYGEKISGLTIYRGWMMKPKMYKAFYELLEEQGIILINTPEEYERYHLLPGWYEDFADETVYSVWENQGTLETALQMTKNLEGSYIVKDYVKSRKHEWYDACFIPDVTKEEQLVKTIRNFIERQGDGLIGGVVLRKFTPLKSIGFHKRSGMPISEEYRLFVYADHILCIDDYWEETNKNCLSAKEMEWIETIVHRIKSNFVTIDLARKEDGTLIIMELGDGQVSGLQQMDPTDFYSALDKRDEIC